MLPLVGDLAPMHRRATSISIVVSGLSLGMLIARLLSGVIANYTDWRNIYWFAFAAQYSIFILLFFFLPDYPSKNPGGLNYFKMMWSIVHMYLTEPLLVQACLINFIMSSIFTSFWTTMSFLLSSPPFDYDSLVIGLFALIGIFVICWGPVYSRLIIDRIQPLYSCLIGISIELTGVAIGTFIGTFTVAGPIIEAIVIDLGNQACNIANRTAINDINPKARNRVNVSNLDPRHVEAQAVCSALRLRARARSKKGSYLTRDQTCYMIAAFTGQLTGTAVGNRLYALGGWRASGSCNSKSCEDSHQDAFYTLTIRNTVAFLVFALIVCFVRGPREEGWIGWSGGWNPRKDRTPTNSHAESPVAPAIEEEMGSVSHAPQSKPR